MLAQTKHKALFTICALLLPGQAFAASRTAESIISQSDALAKAMAQAPNGVEISRIRCFSFQVGGDDRYRCTVYWDD